MLDIFRDSPAGRILRFLSNNRIAGYVEDNPRSRLPASYDTRGRENRADRSTKAEMDAESIISSSRDTEAAHMPVSAELRDNITVITWYSESDPENPFNWSFGKKLWVGTILFVYTFAVYIGASLYTTSEPDIIQIFGQSNVVAALGLTLYILGYGIGPMLWSPLSEIPAVGRNLPYITTFFIFVILCVPMPLVNNFAGILVLRFLLGFFGSPCLATAGASYGDFSGPVAMPYVIAMWGGGATLAPALGPLVGGFAVEKMGWRWSSWEVLWASSPILVLMFFSLPETSSDNILLRRAQRLRARTGRQDLKSESEIKQSRMDAHQIVMFALIKPWEINARDPAVLFSTFYTALTYSIFYSFFESFPQIYQGIYGFSLGELGLAFLGVLVGLAVAVVLLCSYLYFLAPKQLAKYDENNIPPEARLWPGLIATFLIPIGQFLLAWTARASIHWVVSLLGVAITMCGVFIITQSMFIYLPFTYTRYSGSLFAANGCARSVFAGAAVLYSRPMFCSLGISGGISLLAGCSALCVFGMYGLYHYGAFLRKKSRFAG